MQKLFNKILVPVDFSTNSKKAIEKAVELAGEYNCRITLLYVVTVAPFSTVAFAEGHMAIPYQAIDNYTELELQLKKLADYAILYSSEDSEVDYCVKLGSWNESIIEFTLQNNIDIVLIGQKGRVFRKRKMLLNPDKIAERTNVAVITIPSNRRITKLLSVVIPVTEFLPVRKLMYGIFMATTNKAIIKLLAVENQKTKDNALHYLKRAYTLIKENSDVSVETEVILSNNVAEAVNNFSRLHSADLIILNPGTQTKMPGFMSSFLGNIIQKYSAPPVLTVNPL